MATNPPGAEPLALRIPEAARAVGIGRSTLYALAAEGRVTIKKIGGRSVVPVSELKRLVEEAA